VLFCIKIYNILWKGIEFSLKAVYNSACNKKILYYERKQKTMNKTELVAAIAEEAKISKKDAEAAVKAFVEVVSDELQKDGKVQLIGFGTFEVGKRAARTGRNPQTGETIKIKAAKQPKFKAGAALKEKVNSKPAKKAKKK